MPAILASRAAASLFSSPLSLSASRPAPVPPQTLALSTIVAANELRFITSGTPVEPRRHHRWTPSRRLSAGAPRPRRRQ